MTAAAPRVWHVSVVGVEPAIDVASKAHAREWEVLRVECARLASKQGRLLDLMARGDAVALYEDMHRRPVAVVYEGKPVIRTDPRPPLRNDRTASLSQFCKYKCFTLSTRSNSASLWDSHFELWLEHANCDGQNDPRVLPFHIFAAKGEYELDDRDERQRFRRSHGNRGSLVDKRARRWTPPRPGGRHGREPQTVRGLRLDDGFHWDVTTTRSRALVSANTVWDVEHRGYINVYPDGHVRPGKQCRPTWSTQESKDEDRRDQARSRPKR